MYVCYTINKDQSINQSINHVCLANQRGNFTVRDLPCRRNNFPRDRTQWYVTHVWQDRIAHPWGVSSPFSKGVCKTPLLSVQYYTLNRGMVHTMPQHLSKTVRPYTNSVLCATLTAYSTTYKGEMSISVLGDITHPLVHSHTLFFGYTREEAPETSESLCFIISSYDIQPGNGADLTLDLPRADSEVILTTSESARHGPHTGQI